VKVSSYPSVGIFTDRNDLFSFPQPEENLHQFRLLAAAKIVIYTVYRNNSML